MPFEAQIAAPMAASSPSEVDRSAPIEAVTAPVLVAPQPAPVAARPAVAKPVATAPAPATGGLPKVQPFHLPLPQLISVAEGAGLLWVNSDADKVATVQSMIAAEPRPIRVPRERPPVASLDEGPLVLVETRRDLSQMALPFKGAEH